MIPFPNYLQLWIRFNGNIGALWNFSSKIGKTADLEDKLAITELARKFAEIFGTDPIDEEKELLKDISIESNSELAITPQKFEEIKEEFSFLRSDEYKSKIEEWVKENSSKSYAFYNLLRSALFQPVANGRILRRSCLISLVSFFEFLESDLIQSFYFRFPDALGKPEDRLISLSDLRTMDGLERVEYHFVQKEANSVMQESITKQLNYFKDRLAIDTRPINEYRDSLIEISQRRNLFVHNDGLVNDQYLNKVSEKYIKDKDIQKDFPLNVTEAYLVEAIDIVNFAGFALLQLCWRKFAKEEQDQADKLFIDTMLDLLNQERYELVKKLASFSQTIKISKLQKWGIMINHAIALRDTGDKQKARQIIKELEPNQMPLQLKIAVFTMREEYDRTYELLKLASESGEIKSISPDWPLFRPIKSEQKFKDIFGIE